jgi:hypothetical protein
LEDGSNIDLSNAECAFFSNSQCFQWPKGRYHWREGRGRSNIFWNVDSQTDQCYAKFTFFSSFLDGLKAVSSEAGRDGGCITILERKKINCENSSLKINFYIEMVTKQKN